MGVRIDCSSLLSMDHGDPSILTRLKHPVNQWKAKLGYQAVRSRGQTWNGYRPQSVTLVTVPCDMSHSSGDSKGPRASTFPIGLRVQQ